jgi:hypothetical protein
MNVLLSRAREQLILVASLAFLEEVLLATSGSAEAQDVRFMRELLGSLRDGERKGSVSIVPASRLMRIE